MEAQPTPENTTASATEKRLREILDFDNKLVELIHTGLWMQGVPPLSPIGRAVADSISLDKLWTAAYTRIKADHTEEQLAHYIVVIEKVTETIQNAYSVIGEEVEATITATKG